MLKSSGKMGIVTRPNYVKVRALNEDMEEVELEGEANFLQEPSAMRSIIFQDICT